MTTGVGSTGTITVLLVDDHQMFAESLAAVLATEEDITVVGTASTAAEGEEAVGRLDPDVVVLDYWLPDADGAVAVRSFGLASPRTRIVVLTGLGSEKELAASVSAGCAGFLTKDRAAGDVADAVRAVHAGEIHVPRDLFRSLAGPARVPDGVRRGGGVLVPLTPREEDMLVRLARGESTGAIAQDLGISVNTVRNHVQGLITKMGAHSKLEAVTIAVREGIVDVPR